MRVTLICHVYPPEVAPAGIMVRELAEDLAAHGHDVTLLTGWPNHPKGVLFPGWRMRCRQVEYDPRGFRVIRCRHAISLRYGVLGRLWYYLTFALSTFVNGLAAGPMDSLLSLSTPLFGNGAAWMLARLKGARFVYDIFDLHPEGAAAAGLMRRGWVYRIWRRLDTALCRRSDAITTLGPGLKQMIVARGVPPERITIVPFWLDADRIRPGSRDNAWRRRQAIPADQFVALYAGTLGHISGAQILMEVAERLQTRDDILILVVGEGVAKDALEAEACRRNLRNLRFLPFQPEEVLPEVQATADVGLVTLLPEAGRSSIPSKVLGYMAAGRAVIASVAADSDTAEAIRSAECGLVVPSQDAAAMADAIRRAADAREETLRQGERARQAVLTRYSRAELTALYETVLTR